MARDLSFLWPEMLLAATAAAMLIAEMLRRPLAALWIGLAGLAAATLATLPVLGADTTVFGGTYRIDALSGWAKLIILPATAAALMLARAELAGRLREGSVYVLLCLVSLGALMLAGGGDMMLLVLGVVLTGLGSFALVAYPGDDAGTEAAMKYLVFGSVTGAVMIYGLTFWYGAAGSTLYSALDGKAGQGIAAAAGLVAVLIGLGYKAAFVPFHFWAPDAYEGAPVSVAGYLSVVTKIAAFFALAQVLRDLPAATGWPVIVAVIAAATMTLGYLAALVQRDLVRLMAYSSIAQSGYLLMAIAAWGASTLAPRGLIVFSAAYAAMNLGAFAIILAAGRRLEDLEGFGRRAPARGIAMVLFLLSLTGIPPLFGFVGKFYLFGAAMQAGFGWLALVGIVNTVVGLAVYLRMLVPLYRLPATAAEPVAVPAQGPGRDSWLGAVWIAGGTITLLLGIFATILP